MSTDRSPLAEYTDGNTNNPPDAATLPIPTPDPLLPFIPALLPLEGPRIACSSFIKLLKAAKSDTPGEVNRQWGQFELG